MQEEPALGIEEGGIQSAEALMLSRYFMYSQVYIHPIRRIYDIHLRDFLRKWLAKGNFSTEVERHLAMTDNEVTVAILAAARDSSKMEHQTAARIVGRTHFKVVYERTPADVAVNPEAGRLPAADRALRVTKLKSHISVAQAEADVAAVDKMADEAKSRGLC